MDIPGFRITKLIAEGGMATVFLAIQESLNRKVALKVLKKFERADQSERFINEGRIIASLRHPNVITIHDIGRVESWHYIAMEYLEGGDLEGRIRAGMSAAEAMALTTKIAQCLEFIHSQGVVHRDIKPANILFDSDGNPILTDFGIAKHLDQDSNLTMDGTAMGSPDYLSPEQAQCKELDGRTDIYSLGVVLHEMLTGKKPYRRDSYIEAVMAHITAPIPALPTALEGYQRLLDRMIAKDPNDRFASARELVAFIEAMDIDPAASPTVSTASPKADERHRPEVSGSELTKTVQLSSLDVASLTAGAAPDESSGAAVNAARRSRSAFSRLWLTGVSLVVLTGLMWAFYPIPHSQPTPESELVPAPAPTSAPVPASVSAPALDPVPAPSVAAPVEPHPDIERNLQLAHVAMAEDRLTVPPDDNAHFYFQQVLAVDPQHAQAEDGLAAIAGRYADMAARQFERRHYQKADDYLQKGLGVQPDHPRLLTLQRELNESRDADIEKNLSKAEKAMAANNLTVPKDDNAYTYYRRVLALDPEHPTALQGIRKIADRYANLAEWQLGKYNYTKAKRFVRAGLRVQPDNARLLALRQRTDASKDIPDRMLKGIKSVFD